MEAPAYMYVLEVGILSDGTVFGTSMFARRGHGERTYVRTYVPLERRTHREKKRRNKSEVMSMPRASLLVSSALFVAFISQVSAMATSSKVLVKVYSDLA